MIKIAVTGPISSGKSTVCEILSSRGAYVVSADDIVHNLLQSNIEIQSFINNLLQTNISFKDSSYRKQVAEVIFKNSSLLQKYECMIHPLVFSAMHELYKSCLKEQKYKMFVCEVPLLFETGMNKFFDKIIYVSADNAVCKNRFIKKTNSGADEWENRMTRFSPSKQLKKQSSFVITNNDSIENVINQVDTILNSLQIN